MTYTRKILIRRKGVKLDEDKLLYLHIVDLVSLCECLWIEFKDNVTMHCPFVEHYHYNILHVIIL